MGSFITLAAADGTQVPAYVAQPAAPAKAAVVVIQEIFGVNTHIREVADAYASEGYLAIAPAMFHRVQANVELGYACLLYTSPSPRDGLLSRMPSSA